MVKILQAQFAKLTHFWIIVCIEFITKHKVQSFVLKNTLCLRIDYQKEM